MFSILTMNQNHLLWGRNVLKIPTSRYFCQKPRFKFIGVGLGHQEFYKPSKRYGREARVGKPLTEITSHLFSLYYVALTLTKGLEHSIILQRRNSVMRFESLSPGCTLTAQLVINTQLLPSS